LCRRTHINFFLNDFVLIMMKFFFLRELWWSNKVYVWLQVSIIQSCSEKHLCGPEPRILVWSHTKREERRERKWRREKRRERRQILVCVTKPKFLVLVHTRFSPISIYMYSKLHFAYMSLHKCPFSNLFSISIHHVALSFLSFFSFFHLLNIYIYSFL
jgi:hypothetical protein